MMILLPLLVFIMLLTLWCFAYHANEVLVYMCAFAFFGVGVCAMVIDRKNERKNAFYIGLMVILAVIFSAIGGSWDYEEYFKTYWSFQENRKYTNVLRQSRPRRMR